MIHHSEPWWVRVVRPLKTNCFACNIWRGIIVGAVVGFALGVLAVVVIVVVVGIGL